MESPELNSKTPRTDAFVDALPPIILEGLTREQAFAIGSQVRELMVAWATHARALEVELANSIPREWLH